MFISKPFQSPLVDSPSTFPALEIPSSSLFLSYSMCTTPFNPLAHALFTQTLMQLNEL